MIIYTIMWCEIALKEETKNYERHTVERMIFHPG